MKTMETTKIILFKVNKKDAKTKKNRKKKKEKIIMIDEGKGKSKEKINDENYTIEIMSGNDYNEKNMNNNNYPLYQININ
jgi:hypothetical protein